MKFRFDKKYFFWGLTITLSIIAGILFYYILFHSENLSNGFHTFVTICMPIIDGLILAYLITPILNTVENKLVIPIYIRAKVEMTSKIKKRVRTFSILITMVFIFVVIYEFFSLIIPELIRSIQSIYFQFPVYVRNLSVWATGLLENNPELEGIVTQLLDRYSTMLEDLINSKVLPKLNQLLITLSSSVISFFKAMWNLIIGFIISIYVLGRKETFAGQAKKMAYAFFETETANHVINNFRFIHATFGGFISGKIVDSIIIGIICFVCTSLIGTPYAILVSVIVGVTNIIPFFGPWFGGIPSALLILMVNPVQCLYFIILILVIQQFDGNILGPKILGDSTGLSGFWVIFAITIFGGLFGVLGMIVGVPIFAVFYAGFKSLVNRMLAKKKLPVETSPYLSVGSITENNTFTEYTPPEKKKRKSQEKNSRKEVSKKE